MTDMSIAIVPKSDQLNADDLIAGPRTIRVTRVTVSDSAEQKVAIYFEGDGGKPYKPCKSMCRVLVHAWGPDSSKYAGRSMTLYRDPSVKWAGIEVGGIRISHLSDIRGPQSIALTVTRGKRSPHKVDPLRVESPKPTQKPPTDPPTAPWWQPIRDAAHNWADTKGRDIGDAEIDEALRRMAAAWGDRQLGTMSEDDQAAMTARCCAASFDWAKWLDQEADA